MNNKSNITNFQIKFAQINKEIDFHTDLTLNKIMINLRKIEKFNKETHDIYKFKNKEFKTRYKNIIYHMSDHIDQLDNIIKYAGNIKLEEVKNSNDLYHIMIDLINIDKLILAAKCQILGIEKIKYI